MDISETSNADELFRLWKAARPDYTEFSNDGILLQEEWQKQRTKIAFILKEPNDDFIEIRGRSHLPSGNSTVFWRNINMWSFTVKQFINGAPVTLGKR